MQVLKNMFLKSEREKYSQNNANWENEYKTYLN